MPKCAEHRNQLDQKQQLKSNNSNRTPFQSNQIMAAPNETKCFCDKTTKVTVVRSEFSKHRGKSFHACATDTCRFWALDGEIPKLPPPLKCYCGLTTGRFLVKKETSKHKNQMFHSCPKKENPCRFWKLAPPVQLQTTMEDEEPSLA